jgi:hypothetical protein
LVLGFCQPTPLAGRFAGFAALDFTAIFLALGIAKKIQIRNKTFSNRPF